MAESCARQELAPKKQIELLAKLADVLAEAHANPGVARRLKERTGVLDQTIVQLAQLVADVGPVGPVDPIVNCCCLPSAALDDCVPLPLSECLRRGGCPPDNVRRPASKPKRRPVARSGRKVKSR